MSEPRVSEGLGNPQGQGSTKGKVTYSGPHGGGATFGGSTRISSAVGPS